MRRYGVWRRPVFARAISVHKSPAFVLLKYPRDLPGGRAVARSAPAIMRVASASFAAVESAAECSRSAPHIVSHSITAAVTPVAATDRPARQPLRLCLKSQGRLRFSLLEAPILNRLFTLIRKSQLRGWRTAPSASSVNEHRLETGHILLLAMWLGRENDVES